MDLVSTGSCVGRINYRPSAVDKIFSGDIVSDFDSDLDTLPRTAMDGKDLYLLKSDGWKRSNYAAALN
jgi:hypothetical protein